jgi:transposase
MDIQMMRRQGLSIRKIAALRGLSRNAVRRALRSAKPPSGKRRRSQGIKLAPFQGHIAAWLRDLVKAHWTGARMLDELRGLGSQGGRTVLLDHLRHLRPTPPVQAQARFHVKPGQQVQIDWAEMGVVPVGGVLTKIYAFVAILAWSRTLFVHFTTDMQLIEARRSSVPRIGRAVPSRTPGEQRWASALPRAASARLRVRGLFCGSDRSGRQAAPDTRDLGNAVDILGPEFIEPTTPHPRIDDTQRAFSLCQSRRSPGRRLVRRRVADGGAGGPSPWTM